MTNRTEDHFATKPCTNGCIRKGTEKLDQPQLMGATHGNYCDREYFATRSALEQAAEVIEHVVSLINSSSQSEDLVQASKEAPLPFNVQAFNDANETYGRLVYWVRHWSGKLHRQAPGAAVRAWSNAGGTIIGLPADVTPSAARYAVSMMTTWLRAHLDDIMDTLPADDVLYFHDELADVFRIAARWPFKMKARFAKIPCPQDGSRIAVYPPEKLGDEMRIVCDNGHVYDEDKFEFYVREFGQIQRAKDSPEAVKRHLTSKYVA